MKIVRSLMAVFLGIVWMSTSAFAQHGGDHSKHMAEMNKRGDRVMGFEQSKTTHHFRLFPDGGAIEVNANDPKDTPSRDQIQQHLTHIAKAFSEGDFVGPTEVHNQMPPGAQQMKERKAKIEYTFENTENGGRVRIKSVDSKAVGAIHEFLRFQINEHQTGDPLSVAAK